MDITNSTPTCPICPREHLESMYPEEYHRVYPMVKMYTEMYDIPSNPNFFPYPTREAVEHMADCICNSFCTAEETEVNQQFGVGFGRRFLRSFVLVLLIRELLRRRRFF